MCNIYIASYKRADRVRTYEFLETGYIVVPESQAEDYRAKYGDAVLTISDEQDGSVSKKRNAILDLIAEREDDNYGWIIDDDFTGLRRKKEDTKLSGDETLEVMEKLEIMAKDMGAKYGGFDYSEDTMKLKDMAPFSLTKPIFYITLVNPTDGLRYDERLRIKEDVDFYLQKMNNNRRIIKDNQYCAISYGKDGGADSVIKYNRADQRYYATLINNKWGYKAMEWKKTSFRFNHPIKGV